MVDCFIVQNSNQQNGKYTGMFEYEHYYYCCRYIDKQKILLELEDNKRTLEQGCKKLIETRIKCDVLVSTFFSYYNNFCNRSRHK